MEIEPKLILHINKMVNEKKKTKEKFLPKRCPDFLLCLFVCHIVSPVCQGHYNIEMNTIYSLYYDVNRVFEIFRKKYFFDEIWPFL